MATIFDGAAQRGKKIVIDGQNILIRPKNKDVVKYSNIDKSIEDSMEAIVDMVCRGNPEAIKDDVEAHVSTNYGAYATEVSVALGFTTHEELAKQKAARLAKVAGEAAKEESGPKQ
jgi:hypothetical protein